MKINEILDVLLRFEVKKNTKIRTTNLTFLPPNNTSFYSNVNIQRHYFTFEIGKTGSLFDY